MSDIVASIGINVEKARTTLRATIEGYDICETRNETVKHIIGENIEAIYTLLEVVDDYCDNAEKIIEDLQQHLDEKGGVAVG